MSEKSNSDKHKKHIEEMVLEETDDEGSLAAAREKLKKLREELKKCQAERQEHLTGWQRARADYINARREEEQGRQLDHRRLRAAVILEFLPLADYFEMAFSNSKWALVDSHWRSGIENIYRQLVSTLSALGVEPLGAVGDKFDPKLHQPVKTEEVENQDEDDKILTVVEKGYKLGEDILRPAKVIVGKYQ